MFQKEYYNLKIFTETSNTNRCRKAFDGTCAATASEVTTL